MRIVLRRRFLMIAAACSTSSLFARHACADFFGADLPLLSAIVAQTTATAGSVAESALRLKSIFDTLDRMGNHLKYEDFNSVLHFIGDIKLNVTRLISDIDSMGYAINSLDQNFKALYGVDLRPLSADELHELQGKWHQEVLAASKVAARAQTSLELLQSFADQADKLMSRSTGTFTLEGQMQIMIQLLGLVSAQLKFLQQSLDAANRVTTTAAATEASERMLARERARRLLENYTNRGKPNVIFLRFP